jgi:DNA replication protein DnaC
MTKFSDQFFNKAWAQSNIPMRMRGNGFAKYVPVNDKNSDQPHRQTLRSIDLAKGFVEDFAKAHYISDNRAAEGKFPDDRSKLGKGLLLCGPNGTRKTTLAVAVATEVQWLSPSLHVYYIRFKDWKDSLTATFSPETTEESIAAAKRLLIAKRVPLLVLDDIGQEHRTKTGFTEKELHELLRIRYESARPTIITTNITPENMESVYGTSFESFRHDAFYTLKMFGQDSRKI